MAEGASPRLWQEHAGQNPRHDPPSFFHCACGHVFRAAKAASPLGRIFLDDASLEGIRDRLQTYERESKPVLNFHGRKLLPRVDATQTPLKVLCGVLRTVDKVTK